MKNMVMEDKDNSGVILEYDEKISVYGEFAERLCGLVKEILSVSGISVHSVTFRKKERDSFIKKLGKPGASYGKISDVTDLCGLRIITHFSDDVSRISEIIESEFSVDKENSSNKSDSLDPDRFGYLSVHYVLSNNSARSGLMEYRKFKGLKAEVQIRSILQHAWAEIEHDLGYKSPRGVPREVRRRFSRLAGLLELADQEFSTIRDELGVYSTEVVGRIKNDSSTVELNALSLQAFVAGSQEVSEMDDEIARIRNWGLEEAPLDYSARHVEKLAYLGVFNVSDLEEKILENFDLVNKFSRAWLDRYQGSGDLIVYSGISIFYLCYVLAIVKYFPEIPLDYVMKFNIGAKVSREEFAEELLGVFESVVSVD